MCAVHRQLAGGNCIGPRRQACGPPTDDYPAPRTSEDYSKVGVHCVNSPNLLNQWYVATTKVGYSTTRVASNVISGAAVERVLTKAEALV